ncbi:MAG TPA: hypothetical protein ENH29_08910 [Bacteroidetes bacterium]|nr:hypothetical protein [Bacteroidota bacterium]
MLKKDKTPPKVYISVDMEGITDVINWGETEEKGHDYRRYRESMTLEANAAVEGALEAGAKIVVVRDAHGNANNLIPEKLHEAALLIRGWSGGPLMMMEGLDESFDAAVFIGYHAKAGSRDAVLHHTMTGRLTELILNDQAVPELGLNAAIAGNYGVPVVFVSGDRALIDQAKELLGQREYVIVKEGIGTAARNIHPHLSQRFIEEGVKKAVRQRDRFEPFILRPPYTIQLRFIAERDAQKAALIPGSKRTDNLTVKFSSADFMDMLKFFYLAIH